MHYEQVGYEKEKVDSTNKFRTWVAWHPPSRQCGVSTQGTPGVITAVCEYAGRDCGHMPGARHSALREQVCAVRLNAHSVPRMAKSSPKPCVQNVGELRFFPSMPSKCFSIKIKPISSMKPLLVDSVGKLAISSSAHHISLFMPLSQC